MGVSKTHSCISRLADDSTKSFFTANLEALSDLAGFLKADLAISLDVIYHRVEEPVYEAYMSGLFRAARDAIEATVSWTNVEPERGACNAKWVRDSVRGHCGGRS